MKLSKGKILLLFDKIKSRLIEELSSIPDFALYHFSLKSKLKQPTIVFAGTMIHARIPRMARALKDSGAKYNLVLLCKKDKYDPKLSNDCFDIIELFNSEWGVKRIVKRYDSNLTVFHSFGPPYDAANIVVRHAKQGKTVFDYQDLLLSNFELNPPFTYMKKDMVKEKYVLQNVQGIISHSLELQLAKKLYGGIAAKKLFFPNYVDSNLFVSKKEPKLGSEIHLVYAGGIYSKHRNKDYFGGGQLHWLIEKLNKQKIHFHIYPSPVNLKSDLIDYYQLDKELHYFHFHDAVKQDKLAEEMSQYDFGILPFFHRTNKKSNYKRKYATTLKLYNYFEAGIPIIIGEDVDFQNYMGRRYGGSIKAKWEDFDDLKRLITEYKYEELIENVEENRKRLSLKSNIHKVLNFYEILS